MNTSNLKQRLKWNMPLAALPANLSVYCAMYLPPLATQPKRRNRRWFMVFFFSLPAPRRLRWNAQRAYGAWTGKKKAWELFGDHQIPITPALPASSVPLLSGLCGNKNVWSEKRKSLLSLFRVFRQQIMFCQKTCQESGNYKNDNAGVYLGGKVSSIRMKAANGHKTLIRVDQVKIVNNQRLTSNVKNPSLNSK